MASSTSAGQNYMQNNEMQSSTVVGRDGTNINEIEAIVESFNYQVNDEKRKQKVCVHWLKN